VSAANFHRSYATGHLVAPFQPVSGLPLACEPPRSCSALGGVAQIASQRTLEIRIDVPSWGRYPVGPVFEQALRLRRRLPLNPLRSFASCILGTTVMNGGPCNSPTAPPDAQPLGLTEEDVSALNNSTY